MEDSQHHSPKATKTETHESGKDIEVTAPCTTELQKIELDIRSIRPERTRTIESEFSWINDFSVAFQKTNIQHKPLYILPKEEQQICERCLKEFHKFLRERDKTSFFEIEQSVDISYMRYIYKYSRHGEYVICPKNPSTPEQISIEDLSNLMEDIAIFDRNHTYGTTSNRIILDDFYLTNPQYNYLNLDKIQKQLNEIAKDFRTGGKANRNATRSKFEHRCTQPILSTALQEQQKRFEEQQKYLEEQRRRLQLPKSTILIHMPVVRSCRLEPNETLLKKFLDSTPDKDPYNEPLQKFLASLPESYPRDQPLKDLLTSLPEEHLRGNNFTELLNTLPDRNPEDKDCREFLNTLPVDDPTKNLFLLKLKTGIEMPSLVKSSEEKVQERERVQVRRSMVRPKWLSAFKANIITSYQADLLHYKY